MAATTAMTLTSLLNSLHTHLQSQTQLLPTLHAQLGLPPTALEDELKALQDQLIQGVERQIDLRRKQVEGWMEKCEGIEGVCIRYTTALGGNIKATGSNLGELRKEQALPRRYEMVADFQEKLRQAYHTKLEQLSTLTNRLNVLSRTLGTEYFALDILEPTPAAGESQFDGTANRDVTPERFMKLEKELVRGKAEVTKRLQQLSATLVQIDWLYTELGILPPSVDDLPLSRYPLGASVSQPRRTASSSSPSDPFNVSTPTPTSRTNSMTSMFLQDDPTSEYQRILATFVARVEEADDEALTESQSIPIGLENIEPTPGLLQWAASLRASLEDTKRQREAHIQAMYDQLEGLWRRLGVDEGDMDAFVDMHRGSTEDTVREYEEELERMLELKRERMGAFVASAREEIVRLWDDLMIGEEERADFAPFADDEFTEELLTIHEDEIKRLKEERRIKAPLLASIKKYFEICEEEKELAAAASDQTRLLGRGRDPGRLLREEKMRKRVQKEKPRLELDLLTSIPTWEHEAGRPFLVHGESILQVLMETVSAADQENKRKPGRAGSVPPRATTPVNATHTYVPGVKTGVVTPAVRPGSVLSSQSVPNKRQRLGETPSGNTPNYVTSQTQRAPLGAHRAGNGAGHARAASPSKIPSKTPSATSSLPRPVHLAMPVPKVGTQHHALGHGRVPSNCASNGFSGMRSASSTMTSSAGSAVNKRFQSAGASSGYAPGGGKGTALGLEIVKKASRARRESFKPRPSADHMELAKSVSLGSSRWCGFPGGASVKEEEED